MAEVTNTFTSIHKFVSNVRMFKANDPYYYKLDNIHIRQLQENCNYLRDLFTNSQLTIEDINRSSFSELKPYFSGNDRRLKVKPGRFMARINNAYSDNPLQKLIYSDKNSVIKVLAEQDSLTINQLLQNVVKQEFSTNANGLSDRITFWSTVDPTTPYPTIFIQNFGPSLGQGTNNWPLLKGFDFNFNQILRQGIFGDELQKLHNEFVKQWSGVARTAVVDVPAELNIDIPDWDIDDFFTVDANGQKIALTNEPAFRIDLVFIYAKPVDSSGVPIVKFDTVGAPYFITEPTLGLLKGAGLGYANVSSLNNYKLSNERLNTLDAFGNPAMWPNSADSSSLTNGFLEGELTSRDIHASFPSPEDLLNISPNLITDLETNDLQLIGQSILPICYILVENNNNLATNSLGQVILEDRDILDIRPFFRTAELTYNERAGIAGAYPQLSLANPAVGKSELFHEIQKAKVDVISQIPGANVQNPRPIAKAYVWGGFLYGPEGALWDAYELSLNSNSTTAQNILNVFNNQLESNGLVSNAKVVLGFPEDVNIQVPLFPTWDFPDWTLTKSDRGLYPNDWIDASLRWAPGSNNFLGGAPGLRPTTRVGLNLPTQTDIYPSNKPMIGTTRAGAGSLIRFCSKKLTIRNIPTWVKDTYIQASLLNCQPQTYEGADSTTNLTAAFGNVSVHKSKILNGQQEVLITFSWASNQEFSILHPKDHRDNYSMAGVLAISPNFNISVGTGNNVFTQKLMGVCIYPSVELVVIGLPETYSDPASTGYGIPSIPANKSFVELPPLFNGGTIIGYDLQQANNLGDRPWDKTIQSHSTVNAI